MINEQIVLFKNKEGKFMPYDTENSEKVLLIGSKEEILKRILCSLSGVSLRQINSKNLSDDDLRRMMRDPKYWRDADPEYIRKIENGFKKLYS